MSKLTTDILIVGGGPAGIAAAAASAASGRRVIIVDDNPRLGGQIWRAELGKLRAPQALELLAAIDKGSVEMIKNAQVFSMTGPKTLAAETSDGRTDLTFDKLIIATGARELFLPFPGWTLPGVFGAGGLQALVKGGLDIKQKRVVVAGTGPLLLAVASYLKAKGAVIAAVVEQASSSKINRFGLALTRSPAKLVQAARLKFDLLGVPYLTDSWVREATANPARGALHLSLITSSRRATSIECDYLASGYDLLPNTELARLVGCRMQDNFVAVDELQETSQPGIYCAGEPTGIGGVEAALLEGSIAGHAAAGNTAMAQRSFAKREKTRRFTDALARTFTLRNELKTLAEDSTIVCRCEDVQYRPLKDFDNWRSAKLQTRCGMGPCQGRVCGAVTEYLFGWKVDPPRPPLFPVRLENL